MKPTTRIFTLSLAGAAIVALWLMPKMNQARDVSYVRIIEDTETERKVLVTPIEPRDTSSIVPVKKQEEKKDIEALSNKKVNKNKKKYKKEKIESDFKLKDIKPSMYSRAIHFSPEEEFIQLDTLHEDTVVAIP